MEPKTVEEIEAGTVVQVWKDGMIVFGAVYPVIRVEGWDEDHVRVVSGPSFSPSGIVLRKDHTLTYRGTTAENLGSLDLFEVQL